MAVDAVLCRSVAADDPRPVLRLYRWQPPAVSLGHAQCAHREVDLQACRDLGIEVVRRPTGGRAVLHWEELTYSVICPDTDARLGGSISDTYRIIGRCLVTGLGRMGIRAALDRRARRAVRPRGPGATVPCFSSVARWEVMCGGRKLAGSAQWRRGGVVLQHGSLLTGPAHQRIVDLVPGLSRIQRRAWRRELQAGSTDLSACSGGDVDYAELEAALLDGFAETLNVEIQADPLSVLEERMADDLAVREYGDLTRMRAPVPDATRCGDGGADSVLAASVGWGLT